MHFLGDPPLHGPIVSYKYTYSGLQWYRSICSIQQPLEETGDIPRAKYCMKYWRNPWESPLKLLHTSAIALKNILHTRDRPAGVYPQRSSLAPNMPVKLGGEVMNPSTRSNLGYISYYLLSRTQIETEPK